MEGTRVQLLDDVQSLVLSRTLAHIVWIVGMAGTGKTSIALTLCRRLAELPSVLLGGTFFCSRSAGEIDQTDARRIIPTLSVVLSRRVRGYAQALAAELRNDPDLASKIASVQVEHLLLKPLESVETLDRQIIFVIDALDECADQNQLAELIDALAEFRSRQPVKFLFTSRPEMHIRHTSITDTRLSSIIHLWTVDHHVVTSDIRLYLERSLEKVSKSSIWYTADDLDELAVLSAGLFIFASTALAYILGRRDVPGRSERLRTVKNQYSTSALATGPLDRMYSLVLTQASNPNVYEPTELDETRRIVAVILSARAPLTVKALADLLGLSPEHLRGALNELHAVVFVPEQDHVGELRTLHASFGDFIFTRAPEDIRIGKELGHNELARACLERMSAEDLCFNISRSSSSYKPNPEVKPGWIAHSLVYACLHWAHHIALASRSCSFDKIIYSVLRQKLLFWLETLSVMAEIGHASGLLRIAAAAVSSNSSYIYWASINVQVTLPDVLQFLRDANFFVASSYEAIERSSPHIYLSALPFVSKDSLIYQTFSSLLTGIPVIETFGINRNDGHSVMVLAGHTKEVTAIAYSPGDRVIASGSYDGTVRLWDTLSGAETRSPLESKNGAVISVAYTSGGDRLVAGTRTGYVMVWDTITGRLRLPPLHVHSGRVNAVAITPDGGTIASVYTDFAVGLWHPSADNLVGHVLRGHENWPYALSFSPDGTMLASGGMDGIICLWDYRSGRSLMEPIKVPRAVIFSVSFSRDGTLLASGSSDQVARVWNVLNGQQLRSHSGHQHFVNSVAFAPDDCSLASASTDLTVRIWNLHDKNFEDASLILRGHSQSVNVVCYSNDGQNVASGSSDGTIRIWNASGKNSISLQIDGHTDRVNAVAISHDSRLIASASADGTACVWDAQTCEQLYPPLVGHEHSISSIAFSSDDQCIATGSEETTIWLWNARTGQPVMPELCGHTSDVIAIVFSPNSLHLASASDDQTVRFWEVATGQPAEVPQIQWDYPVYSVAYSPNGGIIAFGDKIGAVVCIDALTGQYMRTFHMSSQQLAYVESTDSAHQIRGKLSQCVRSLAFSPEGTQIVATSQDVFARFDVHVSQRDTAFPGHPQDVNAATYSPDGLLIASAVADKTVRLWDANTLEQLQPKLFSHMNSVSSVAISSDGRFLVSGSRDETVRRWNLEAIRSLHKNRSQSPLASLAFARYGQGWLVSPSDELLLWVPPEYRGHLEIGDYSRIIATHRVVVTANDDILHQGEQWTRCWRSDGLVS